MIHSTINNRQFDGTVSCLKMDLMFLVVWGHVFSQLHPLFTESRLCQAVYDFIYSFHMPLFVFISGWLSKKYIYRKGAVRLLNPNRLLGWLFSWLFS